jgi:hypothetical protein
MYTNICPAGKLKMEIYTREFNGALLETNTVSIITARKLLIAKLMQFAISAVDKLIGRPQLKGNNKAENL